MKLSELIKVLSEIEEHHGDIDVRTVEPQYRSTPASELVGGFVDSDGLVLVTGVSDGYFHTDNEEAYDYAQAGDWEY